MIARSQAKIALDVKIARGAVRLSKSRVALLPDEIPVVPKPHDLPSRCNPIPLLIFFAYCKLHFIETKENAFQARSGDQKWVIQLYDLLKNCGKKQTCWLEKVFGASRTTPNVCSIHSVVAAFKDGREHVVALATTAPEPDEIELTLDGAPVASERELQQFLQRLGTASETLPSPDLIEHETPPATAPSGTEAGATVNQYVLPEQFEGTISLQFPKFNLAHSDFERECFKQLTAGHKLEIKWLGMGMEYGAAVIPDLLRTLLSSVPVCEITVSVAMLDPNWPFLEHLHVSWPNEVRESYDKLSGLAAMYRAQSRKSKKTKVAIAVHGYEYIPNWHGFVINNTRFYLGVCSWKDAVPGSGKKILAAAENPYIVARVERGGFEAWLASAFLGWFDYAFNWSGSACAKKQADGRKRC